MQRTCDGRRNMLGGRRNQDHERYEFLMDVDLSFGQLPKGAAQCGAIDSTENVCSVEGKPVGDPRMK